jgi:hypothetical protein
MYDDFAKEQKAMIEKMALDFVVYRLQMMETHGKKKPLWPIKLSEEEEEAKKERDLIRASKQEARKKQAEEAARIAAEQAAADKKKPKSKQGGKSPNAAQSISPPLESPPN